MREDVHGKFPVAVLEFNKFGMSRRISVKIKSIIHENVYRVVT